MLAAHAVAQSPAQESPKTLALLVGVDRYAQPTEGEWKTLRGCENDIQLVAEVLVERFGFRPEDIVTLKSEQATHEAIVRAFYTHLIERAGKDTKVVFWFSGHGSQVPDPSQKDRAAAGDYEPNKDQTMLAHDSRKGAWNGSYDLADDELHSLLAALKSRDVVLVTDCCHSGGLSRGGEQLGVRGEADGDQPHDLLARKQFWPETVALLEDDDLGSELLHVVQIAACAAHEEAGEIEAGGRVHGTLTWFLCQAMRELPATASWREVVETVRARIAGRMGSRPAQYVDAIGKVSRAMLSGTARPVPLGYVVEFSPAGDLQIGAGRIHGIGKETTFDLRDIDGKRVAGASVIDVRGATTTVKLNGPAKYGKALWAVPTGKLDGRSPLSVCLPDDKAQELIAQCAYGIATDADHADYQLARVADEVELRKRNGETIARAKDEPTAVQALLFRETNFRFLWDAVAARGVHPIEVCVRPALPEQCEVTEDGRTLRVAAATIDARAKGSHIRVTAPLLDDRRDSGAIVVLEIANRSDEDLFVAVLSVQEDRAITLVLGNDRNSNLIHAGEVFPVRVQVGPSAAWLRNRPMVDRYLVFATPRFADFRPFAQAAPTTVRGGGEEEGLSLLQTLQFGEVTRGSDAPMPWGIAYVDLELHAPTANSSSQPTKPDKALK